MVRQLSIYPDREQELLKPGIRMTQRSFSSAPRSTLIGLEVEILPDFMVAATLGSVVGVRTSRIPELRRTRGLHKGGGAEMVWKGGTHESGRPKRDPEKLVPGPSFGA